MNELTLTWQESGRVRTQIIHDQQPTKNPGTVRIGRDPSRCDIVLTDPTVSGLHVEIFFHPQQYSFYLRNLRPSNPPLIEGQGIIQGEVPLRQSSIIYLGQLALTVSSVYLTGIGVPATIVIPPQLPRVASQPPTPAVESYGLRCSNSKCGKTSPYSRLDLGCPWCGTSLAAAVSILMTT